MGSHAAWNGSLLLGETETGMVVTLFALLGFVVLFVLTVIGVIMLRARDQKRYNMLAPHVASRYGVPVDRALVLLDASQRSDARKALTSKEAKARFDAEASALTRLAAMLDFDGTPIPEQEAMLVTSLAAARSGGGDIA